MSRSNHLKEKNRKSIWFSEENCGEGSAARTRPFSFEEIMLRRRNKELLDDEKDPKLGFSSEKIADHFESSRIFKHDRSSTFGMEKRASEELVNISSRKKVESTYVKEDSLTERNNRAGHILDSKSSAGLNNKSRITKEKAVKEICGSRKSEKIDENSRYKDRNKHSRDSVNKDSYAETDRPKAERKTKKRNHIEEDENPNDYLAEKRHDRDRDNRFKSKKRLGIDFEEVPEKTNYRGLDKDKHAEGRARYERETKRKHRNEDDETQDRNKPRKQDLVKHHNVHVYERKERREKAKSHHEELTAKRRHSRSRERENRRSRSFSPRMQKHTYLDGERKELSVSSLKDGSRKKHSDVDRNRVSTNGSSSHHHRHGGSTSGLGGYSPRKRKSEAAVKTPSPSKHSREKKHAGWDLAPVGTNNPSPAVVSSGFQLSNCTVLSNMQDVASGTSLDLTLVKPLPVSFLSDLSSGKNTSIDSVQLTQATRPLRRLYIENLPASASEKAVMDCFNNLLLCTGVNHIQQARPCISCILHKDRGQALVEFLTAQDASAALSFDGSTLFGSTVKIRRPKDYVEVATGEPERSVDAAVTISDVVIDSPHKIFIGGISCHLSSDMLMKIAGAFGSLKAYHFETCVSNGSCAFLEYVDHSVTSKACAGLNGMKLGGEALTVVQAMPDASPLESASKPASYVIPEHAKPLLRKPTEVLKIKNVFAADSLSSLSDMAMEEILEDVRLECARFGTIKSINVVKHSSDRNLTTELEECEVINKVDSKDASQDMVCITNNTGCGFAEKVPHTKSRGKNGVELHDDVELEDNKIDGGSSVNVDKSAEVFDNKSCQEHPMSDTTVEDVGDKGSIIQECPDQHDTPDDGPEFLGKMVAIDIDVDVKNKMVGDNVHSDKRDCVIQEGFSEQDTSSELVGPKKGIDEEGDISGNVFEPGSILVEYGRAEACCSAAHCLHGRFFEGRMVTVEYVALSLYRARFTN
ncbi:hypothetical protein RJT34_24300 [Clitoria ternatea]|uniref:RRM domain-containing protein n=1 Tax=Clitoria ternatea TaxID=43366 RepID=A0AAN9FUD6_CLITE